MRYTGRYVEQDPRYALGNFINCTPTIRRLAERYGDRIPVLFHHDYVRQCFTDCPFIRHIDHPSGPRSFGSELINRTWKNTRHPMSKLPDYAYIFRKIIGRKWDGEHTYVDSCGPVDDGDYIVVINGSGNETPRYVTSKDVGAAPYMEATRSHRCIFVGSSMDLHRNPWGAPYAQGIGDIREALRLISGAKAVIANDTGLAHAAGALNKPILVLWKDTPFPRCSNPGQFTEYAFTNHADAVIEFLRRHLPPHNGDTSRTSVRHHGEEALEQREVLRSTSRGTAGVHGGSL